jgi:hypothetical protein
MREFGPISTGENTGTGIIGTAAHGEDVIGGCMKIKVLMKNKEPFEKIAQNEFIKEVARNSVYF